MTSLAMDTVKEKGIASIASMGASELYQEGVVDIFLDVIKKQALSEVPIKVDTKADRQHIISMAAKIAKTKVHIDSLGKELVSDWKRKSKLIDTDRKRYREGLDALRDQVRQPVTDWEKAEEQRIYNIKTAIQNDVGDYYRLPALQVRFNFTLTSKHLRDILSQVRDSVIDSQYAEFEKEAHQEKATTITELISEIAKAAESEEQEALIAKELKESQEKAQKEREEKIANEAILQEQARMESERQAEALKLRQAQETIKRAADLLEYEKARLQEDKKEQEEKNRIFLAEQDKQRYVEAEERREIKARELDVEHRNKFNNGAYAAFIEGGLEPSVAKLAVDLIIKKLIPNVTLNY